MDNLLKNTKMNFYYGISLLLIIINLFLPTAIAKGGGGGKGGGVGGSKGGGSSSRGGGGYIGRGRSGSRGVPFFIFVNGRRVCTTACIITFVVISVVIIALLGCLCYICSKKYKRNNTKRYHNTTDIGESGESEEIITNNNVSRGGDDDSSPPSYESTNPAPDPPHIFGKKHEATDISLRDARVFSKKYPPNEIYPAPEEIKNITQDVGYNAWKFTSEDAITKAQRSFISDDGRKVELYKRNRKFKYDDIMIQTNYPFFIPANSIELDIMHYFEVTLLSKVSKNSTVAIGISTKPYPYFRLPGWNVNSVGYHSDDGRKFWNDEFGGRDYGPDWGELDDVIGCGYKPKTGEIFFTKNGNFLGMAFAGLRHTWYPTIGSDGDVKVKINYGDEPFVYKDAQGFGVGAPNVKK